ncbi:MAG: hypothetical protein OXE81_10590, partial [Gammaproteobacteria bacterium]|nr:hypothetical protein [Gammaproteobacteria bacterium]
MVLAVGKATDSAKEGTDYTEVGAVSITIDANSASGSATFTLTPADDTIDDDAESLTVEGSVTGESGVTVSSASITIDDNDGAPTGIALSANPSTVAENAATAATITVTATVTGGTTFEAETTVAVTVGDADDTATSGEDYAAVESFDIDIPAGAASATATFSLDPTDDAIAEGAEKLTVSGESGDIDVESAEVTITDDEGTPTAALVLSPAAIDESGASNASTVTATLNRASSKDLTLTVSAGSGVTLSTNKVLTIDAGETESEGTVTLTAADNDVDAADLEVAVSATASGGNGVANPADQTLTVRDDDARGVTVSKASLTVRETDDGTTDSVKENEGTYTVVLDSEPAAGTVTVAVTSGDTKAATVSPPSLTFNTANWSTAQTVTVTGVDDDTDNANDRRVVTVTHAVSTTGNGNDYAALASADPVTVTVTDDDAAPGGIALSVDTPSVGEGAGATEVTVTATITGTTRFAEAQTVAVSVGGGTAMSATDYKAVAAFNVTIPAMAASGSASFTLTPTDDDVDEDSETIDVTGTLASVTVTKATISLTDDDTRGVTVTGSPLTISEADDAQTDAKENEGSYTVVLDSRPTASVTINLSAGASAPVTLDRTSLTFAPDDWNTAQTVTVTAVDDAYDNAGDERTASIAHTVVAGSSDYGSVTVSPVSVTVTDDDAAPSAITLTVDADTGTDGVQTSVAEGGGAKTVRVTATLAGSSRFPAAKTVVLAVGKATDSAKEGTDYTEVGAVSITIDANAASGSATFTLTPADDTIDDDAESLTIEGSVTGESGVTVSPASITIDDNDGAPTGIALSANPSTVAENAATAATITVTATVTGGTAYNTETTVTVTVGDADDTAVSDTDYAEVADFDIDIPADAASATGTFSLDPTDDAIAEGAEKLTVSGASGSIKVTDTEVTITDDEGTPTAALVLSPATINESGDSNASTVTASLNRASSKDLTLTVSAGSGVTLSANKVLTIDAGETESEGTVTLTAINNEVDAADLAVTVSATTSGGNGVANPADQTLTIRDDDTRGVTVAPKTLTVRETDDSTTNGDNESEETYTVVLDSKPAAGTVTVAVTSGDTTAATVSPPSLTFNTANWSTAQTVTVTGVDDDTDNTDDKRTLSVTHAVSTTGDGNDYAALASADPVTVTVTDDDAAPGGIALSVDTPSLGEGAGATEVTVTATVTGATRFAETQTVAVSVGGGTATSGRDYEAVAAFNLTIPAMAASGSAAFTLTPTDDDVDEDGETIDVTGSLAGVTVTKATISLTDDDTRGVTVTGSPLTLDEADDPQTDAKENEGTYTVVLTSRPTASVTINLSAGASAPVTLDRTSLTFAPDDWNTAQTVTVTAVDDAYDNAGDERSASIAHTVVAGTSDYGGVTAVPVAVTVNDDDAAPSRITLAVDADTGTQGVQTSVGEGGGAKTVRVTATLSGNSRFPAAKTVVLAVGKATDSAKEGTDYTEVGAVSITIQANAASGSATFTLTPINDTIDDDAESLTIEGSVTGESGVTVSPASITIDDNDGAPTGIALSANPSTVAENAATAATITVTATVTGGTAYDTETTVTVTVGDADDTAVSDTDYAEVADFDIDIPADAASATGTFSLDPTDDAIAEGAEKLTVSGASGSIKVTDTEVTITDDEGTPTATLVLSPAAINESGAGNASTVTATLNRASSKDLTLTVSAGSGVTLSTNKVLTIDAGETESEGTVTLTAEDNDVDAADLRVTVSAAASGGNGIANPANQTLTVRDDDARGVTVSKASLSVREADDAETDAKENEGSYTVVLDSRPTANVVVNLSAGLNAPVTLDKARLTFAPAQWDTAQTVTVTAVDDAYDNADDRRTASITHTVVAGTSDYGGVTATPVAVTVTDDDAAPSRITLTVDADTATDGVQTSVAEGGGAKTVRVTATITGNSRFPAETTVTLAVGTSTDSAREGTDYETVADQTITIAAGASSGSVDFTLTPKQDVLAEGAEAISLDGTSGTLDVTDAAISLTDDDAAPTGITLTLDKNTVGEADEETEITVTATVNGATRYKDATTVAVSVGGGTATSATDYKAVAAFNITIPAGEASATGTFDLTPTQDTLHEGTETIDVTGASGTLDVTKAVISLTDDDAAPSFAVADASAAEGDAVTFTVTRSGATGAAATVRWATADDPAEDARQATAGTDYTAVTTARTLSFAVGDSAKTFTVATAEDTLAEGDETFLVELTAATGGATIATGEATGTITDDDAAPTALTLTVDADTGTDNDQNSITENGGAKTVRVTATLGGTSTFTTATTVTVKVGTSDDSATEATDYEAVADRTITIPAGKASAHVDFTLTPKQDVLAEGDETIALEGSATGLDVTDTEITLTDDESLPVATLVLTPSSIAEGASTTVSATLSGASSEAVTLTVSAAPGTGTSAGDYTLSAAITLSFAAGATVSSGTVTIAANDDDIDDAGKQVAVSATVTGGHGVAAPVSRTLTITDDDERGVTVSRTKLTLAEADDAATQGTRENIGTYTVVLDTKPAADTVTIAIESDDKGIATVSPASLTFNATNWDTAQTVTVTAVADAVDNTDDKRIVDITHALTAAGDGNDYGDVEVGDVEVTVTDDEGTPAATLVLSPAAIDESGASNSSTVTATLNRESSQDLTLTVSASSGVTLSANKVLTIDAGKATSEGTVTLTAINNEVDAADLAVTVSATASGGNGIANPTDQTLTVRDDDARGVTVTGSPLTISEADDIQTDAKENEGSYTVVLTSRPTASVTINLSAGASAPVTLDKTSLTFAPAQWDTAQTVTVTAVDDAYDNPGDERSASIAHTVVAGTSDYGGVTAAPVAVTVNDDDAAPSRITLAVDADTGTQGVQTSVGEGGGAKTVRVTATLAGSSRFPAAKTVVLAVGKATDSAVEGTDYTEVGAVSITIDANAASGSATFTLTPADDTIDDDAESLTVEGSVTGESGVTVSPVSITIDDNDGAPTGIAL